MSFVQSGLVGLGKFILLTSAFCIATVIAITGPPTPSETASVSSAASHVVRRIDSAALRFTLGLCDSVPLAAHAAGLCTKPVTTLARTEAPERAMPISSRSETLPASAREVLPPDTIDQLARPSVRHARLVGGAPLAPRAAHVRQPRFGHARSRASHAAARHATGASAHVRRHARAHLARPHRVAPPAHHVRATPIATARRPAHAAAATDPTPRTTTPISGTAAHDAPPPQAVGPAPDEYSAPDDDKNPPDVPANDDMAPNDEPPPPDDGKL